MPLIATPPPHLGQTLTTISGGGEAKSDVALRQKPPGAPGTAQGLTWSAQWLFGGAPGHSGGAMPKVECGIVCTVCGIAGACTYLKCAFGGIANFVCDSCVGVDIACIISSFFL